MAKATSMAQLQQAAAAMVAESRGHCSEATLQFARAGSWGKFPGNIERDIMRSLQLPLETWPQGNCNYRSCMFFSIGGF